MRRIIKAIMAAAIMAALVVVSTLPATAQEKCKWVEVKDEYGEWHWKCQEESAPGGSGDTFEDYPRPDDDFGDRPGPYEV